jgi:hypothetical protein
VSIAIKSVGRLGGEDVNGGNRSLTQTDRLVSLKSKKLKGKIKNCGFGLKAETDFLFFAILRAI